MKSPIAFDVDILTFLFSYYCVLNRVCARCVRAVAVHRKNKNKNNNK